MVLALYCVLSRNQPIGRKKMSKTSKASKTTSKTTEKTDVVHAVPMAGDRESPSPAKKSKLIDVFKSKVKPTTKEVKTSDRPVVDIDEETQQKFVTFAATRELCDMFEASQKSQTEEIYSTIMDKYKQALWSSKSQPKNPSIKVVNSEGRLDAEGLFMVIAGSKIKINFPVPAEEESPEEAMLRGLVDLGVGLENSKNLIANEVSFVPQWNLNFTDLLYGRFSEGKLEPANDVQISASEILFQVINGIDEEGNALSDRAKIDMLKGIGSEGWVSIKQNVESHTKFYPQLVDGTKFLDRICNYADSYEELCAILKMFSPIHFCRSVKFAVSDTPDIRNDRLMGEARATIVGESGPSDEEIESSYVK